MGAESLTDERILELTRIPKRVVNPGARWRELGRHRQLNYEAMSLEGAWSFEVYCRQSLRMPDSFSCGLRWIAPSGEGIHLVRYNGPAHPHENSIEGIRFQYRCHIHRATARYAAMGRRPESFAEPTDRYQTLGGAMLCLLQDCTIDGLVPGPEIITGGDCDGS